MKIKEIRIEKLFDIFDHTIEFKEGGITLLIGENGFGKTTILKMLEGLFTQKLEIFKEILFKKFIVIFEDNEIWTIKQEKAKDFRISIKSSKDRQDYVLYSKTIDENGQEVINNGYLGYFSRWQKEFIINNKTILIGIDRLYSLITKHSIDYNRDETYDEAEQVETVIKFSNEIIEQISESLSESAELGRKLDSTYPSRLAKQKNEEIDKNTNSLEIELTKLKEKRQLFNEIGLLEEGESEDFEYKGGEDDFMKKVLTVYVEDNKKKLGVLNDISKKIDLFLTIINKRFLYKKLKIDRKKGFIFTSEITKKAIPLTGLSSGEQHQIILLFTLLFKTKENTLILMDEPETSLHISWQNDFVSDLQKIIELVNLEMLIATHSPSIIGNNWELAVELEEVLNVYS